jgi:hypothetical protein
MKCLTSEFYLAEAVMNQLIAEQVLVVTVKSTVSQTFCPRRKIVNSIYSESNLSHCLIILGVHDASEGSQGLKFLSRLWALESLF